MPTMQRPSDLARADLTVPSGLAASSGLAGPSDLGARPVVEDPASAGFRDLAEAVRAAGLLERRVVRASVTIVLTVGAAVAGWVGVALLGGTWATLGLAVGLGLVATRLGFLGHDAGHAQVFASRRANRLLGLVVGDLLIGLSFGWWVPKHSAHHAHPNEVGRDPDVAGGPSGPVGRWMHRWQAPLFLPLMLLRSTGMHVLGAQRILRRRDRAAWLEAVLLTAHWAGVLALLVVVLSPLRAAVFLVVEQATLSLYLGLSFAPNHKAMPLVAPDARMGFARRQVATARNIAGGRVTTFVLGGLDRQIEHHLFPSMARGNLRRAQPLVMAYCAASDLPYHQQRPTAALRSILHQLAATGRAGAAVPGAMEPAAPGAMEPVASHGMTTVS